MQVVLHSGAHFTDKNKLFKSLSKNTNLLAEVGTLVPSPRTYRRQIRDILDDDDGLAIAPMAKTQMMQDMTGGQNVDRIILSNSNFFGVPRGAVRHNCFYPNAGGRLAEFAEIFRGEEIEIFLAIRNPATFLPALVDGSPEDSLDIVTGGSVPLSLRWSEAILRIREAVPSAPLTVWCNEDTPLIWEEILREMGGLELTAEIAGAHDLLQEIMSPDGLARFEAYLKSHPGLSEMQKRRVIAAFLDKFALEDALEEELDLPGWTEELIDALTEAYDEDVFQIERIPGVTLITP